MTRPSRSRKTQVPAFKHVWKDAFQSEHGPTEPMDRAVLFCLYANMDPDPSLPTYVRHGARKELE